ncbi:hypothetical protein [Roseicella sp. DB1501]|uniref:hypothetical protein n=1 Tax=Roseicella sp. DB1501 TaxID=2730925 RepID=UPI001492E50B|nr:hypothetical protein [Roseicella sp. DB1501]NOG69808.1 hypothetical protein [Roseicella sp. DB1501]
MRLTPAIRQYHDRIVARLKAVDAKEPPVRYVAVLDIAVEELQALEEREATDDDYTDHSEIIEFLTADHIGLTDDEWEELCCTPDDPELRSQLIEKYCPK